MSNWLIIALAMCGFFTFCLAKIASKDSREHEKHENQ